MKNFDSAIVWPLIITNSLNVVVGMVDFKMVGVLGVESIAAVGIARQVMMFLMVLMIAISGGASVLVAHAHGAGDWDRVSVVSARSVATMIAAALVIVTPLGLVTARPFLSALGGDESVVALGGGYLRILFAGSAFTMFNFAISGVLLGVGKTKISLVLLIAINLMNIALNYLFIFGAGPIPAMGVAGAAVGTVIARVIGSVAGLWILVSRRFPIRAKFRDAFTFDWPLLRKIIHLGGPRSLQGIVRTFSRLLTIRIITLLPEATEAVSAYSVGMQVRMTSSFIGLAFMSAAMARVGQNKGGGNIELAEKSGWIAACMASGIMAIAAMVFFLIPDLIMAFFTKDTTVISMGRTFFMIVAATEPIMAFAFALSGALRGGGDPNTPFLYAALSDLIIVIAAGYLFAIVIGMGFAGIALAIAISALTRAIPVTIVYARARWKKIVV